MDTSKDRCSLSLDGTTWLHEGDPQLRRHPVNEPGWDFYELSGPNFIIFSSIFLHFSLIFIDFYDENGCFEVTEAIAKRHRLLPGATKCIHLRRRFPIRLAALF